jgi:hypothetical protein
MVRTREHALDVRVAGEGGTTPLRGHITADTKDQLGPLPGGGRISDTKIVKTPADVTAVEALWKQIKRDRVEQWLTKTDAPSKLDRDDIELIVQRGADRVEYFRADLEHAPQPIQDLLAAAAHIHAEIRLGH